MNELAEEFEQHRAYLRTVAYRMLGSVADSDDAVQEAWIRLSRSDADAVENLRAWLTTVVARVCLDMLRSRRARQEVYGDSWLPEPVVTIGDAADPEQEALVADSVGLALLTVLEALTPAERLSFVLHDMFGMPFEEIAPIVGRSEAATRQLASRGRRRVQGADVRPDPDLGAQRHVVDAFLTASRAGDFDALIEVLDPDVVFRLDLGVADETHTGAEAVARRVLSGGTQFAPFARPAIVNGGAGVVVARPGRPLFAVVGFTVAAGRIVEIDVVANPARLTRVDAG
jgi:RNA polymerase sigma-70 factor (ECF subfamily)